MKTTSSATKLFRLIAVGVCLAMLSGPRPAPGSSGSLLPACALSPPPCLKSMSLATTASTGQGLVAFAGGTLRMDFTLLAKCPSCPGVPCASPATPTAASISVDFFPNAGGQCPPGPLVGMPAFSFNAPVAPPSCTPAGIFTTYNLVIPVPPVTSVGAYCAYGSVTVTFSDGLVLTASGGTEICIVPALPGMPGVPRLSLTLLGEPASRRAPGDFALGVYLVRNNDPIHAVALTAFATSRQSAVRPQGANEHQGVFAISAPFGCDFPIQFQPLANCIALPAQPYTQPVISNALPVLPPGGTNIIVVAIRSYGQSASGSCSESALKVAGQFADNTPALACAGTALFVDTHTSPLPCGQAVRDCNFNGLPDARDIEAGISQDRNYNALPDECEEFISLPIFSSVTPTNPMPGTPILVRVAFNEVVPMLNAWANGSPLIRTQSFGAPFWQGTIPADTRPGPQTVYFLGKDQAGQLATHIGTYNVIPPPRITRIFIDNAHNVIIEHNGPQVGRSQFVQENADLSCPTCWASRPAGPHASPHNAGPATGTRFFRLLQSP